jgi:hypothetical protein
MKRFLITYTYRLDSSSKEEWHRHVGQFISALDTDPELKGRIRYRCMKARDSEDYYHLAETLDDEAGKELQKKAFFTFYTDETKRVAGGKVVVLPLDTIAETA